MSPFPFHRLLVLLAVIVLAANIVLAALPTQPPAFGARAGPMPWWSWTFRQYECQSKGPISEDVLGLLPMSMDASTTCPIRAVGPTNFSYAMIGAIPVVNSTIDTALVTPILAIDPSTLNEIQSNSSFTVEVMFTKLGSIPITASKVDFGDQSISWVRVFG